MPDQPDLTELVKHLRTVHFALLLACILTFLASTAGRRGEVSTAHLQLQKISAMRNSWDRWTQKFSLEHINWLRQLGVRWLVPKPEHLYIDSATLTEAGIRHNPGYALGIHLIGAPLSFHLSAKGQDIVLAVPEGALNVSDVFPLEITFPGEDSGSKRFTSLAQFREFWEGARLPRVSFLYKVPSVAYLIVDGKIARELTLKEHDRKENGGVLGKLELQSSRLGAVQTSDTR